MHSSIADAADGEGSQNSRHGQRRDIDEGQQPSPIPVEQDGQSNGRIETVDEVQEDGHTSRNQNGTNSFEHG